MRYTMDQVDAAHAEIAQLEAARASDVPGFLGDLPVAGGRRTGAGINVARDMHARLNANPPDNLTPNDVVAKWRAAVNRLGEITNG